MSYPLVHFRPKRWSHTGAGLVGSFWGMACARYLPGDPWRAGLTLLGVILLSVVLSDIAEESMERRDDARIVIDEWAGYLCAVVWLPAIWPVWISAFILFRLLDVYKPGWIGLSCQLPGGWGVVMDDVLAGFAANLILRLLLPYLPV